VSLDFTEFSKVTEAGQCLTPSWRNGAQAFAVRSSLQTNESNGWYD